MRANGDGEQWDGWYLDDVAIYDTDTSAPVPGTVTPYNTAAGSYVSPTFDLTTTFTDPQSRATVCQYTIDGGTTWNNAVLTGTGPTNICTVTGLTGTHGQQLTLNMKATSFGGTAFGTPVTVTVDGQGPNNGTLTTTAGDARLTLNWSGFSDGGSGLRVANTYKVSRGSSGYPNASCTNGVQVYLGNALTFQDTGLTNRSTYYYRVCAYDDIGNISTGAIATGRPLPSQAITFNPIPAKTYGTADFAPGATASSGLSVSYASSNTSVAIIVNGKIHIVGQGSTDITASQPGDSNWLPAVSVTRTLTVNRATITVTADNKSKTYGAANPALTYTLSGFVNGETAAVVSGTPVLGTTAGTGSPAGTYPITVNAGTLAAANYTFTLVNGTLTVNRATLTITADNKSKTYGDANPTFTYTPSGFVNNDTAAVLSGSPAFSTTATAASPVGAYPITPTAGTLAAANYTFSFVNGTLTVNKAILSITADNKSRGYGDANPQFTYTPSGFRNNDTAAVLSGTPGFSTTAIPTSPVGPYPITITAGNLAATNYSFTFVHGTLTVNKKALTVTADNKSKVYGDANPALTYTITGFANNETTAVVSGAPTLGTTATAASPVGTYPVTITSGSLAATNYSFTMVNGILTVNKATLTITADNKSRLYGDANPAFTYTPSGFVNNDTAAVISGTPLFGTPGLTTSPVGTYPIIPGIGSLAAANYTFAFVNGTLTVNKATLTITAVNKTRTYGTANPTLTYSASGYRNGDTSAALSGAPVLGTTATTASPVGTYPITATAGTLAATNYSFTFVNGNLTVNRATLTITAINKTRYVGEVNPDFNFAATGFRNGDTVAVLSGAPGIATLATPESPAGNYPITITAGTLTAANYSFVFVDGTLTVIQQYLLTINVVGGGTVNNFNPNSPLFNPCTHSSCSDRYDPGSQFTLRGSPAVSFMGWTGGGCTTGDCQITLNSDTTVTATFTPTIRIVGYATPYQLLQAAYDAAAAGQMTAPVLLVRNFPIDGNFVLDSPLDVVLMGGYADTGFSASTDYTTLNGDLLIEKGSLEINKLIVK